MEKRKVVIVHGSPDDEKDKTYDKHWIPWLKKELERRGFKVSVPLMPEPWNPKYEDWKREFEKINVDENSILIGHSAGCAFLVHWLGEAKRKVKRLILVAPWKVAESERKKDFYDFRIDPEIKNRVGSIIMFTSDNEREAGKRSFQIYKEILGGKAIILKNHGHFTERSMGTREFPELLEEVLK